MVDVVDSTELQRRVGLLICDVMLHRRIPAARPVVEERLLRPLDVTRPKNMSRLVYKWRLIEKFDGRRPSRI